MCFIQSEELIQKPVYSGLGEEIGIVVGVEPYPSGFVHKLWVLEQASGGEPKLRVVDERFVREVTPDRVLLKGPREGFHITRVTALLEPEQAPADARGA